MRAAILARDFDLLKSPEIIIVARLNNSIRADKPVFPDSARSCTAIPGWLTWVLRRAFVTLGKGHIEPHPVKVVRYSDDFCLTKIRSRCQK